LYGVLVDAALPEVDALGARARPAGGDEPYTILEGLSPDLSVVVQAVDDTPRYHVDIETDDVAGEVARLRGSVRSRSPRRMATL
jgi:hypothetical protein